MSTSTIYNHRSLQPTGPPAQGPSQQHSHARLNESFEAIRQEFDALVADLGVIRSQRDDYESKVASQVNELNIIRQSIYDLEAQHGKVRQSYEDELNRLRADLLAARQGQGQVGIPGIGGLGSHPPAGIPGVGIPTGPPPPPTNIPSASSAPGLPPPPYNDPAYYNRDRDRDRDRDRMLDRERIREREAMGVAERENRDRERERDRDRDRDRDRERERDRPTDQRDAKRLKTDRIKTDRPDHFSPSLGPGPTPKLLPPTLPSGPGLPPPQSQSQQSQPSSSYNNNSNPASSSNPSAPGNPSMPPLSVITGGDHPSSSTAPPVSSSSNAGSNNNTGALIPISGPPAPPLSLSLNTNNGGAAANIGFPDDLDPHNVPPELKKEGSDWFAIFNPKVKRVLDVNLVHTLMHESVVCCVRFSSDGKYLATGCNRTAQIYDTKTGVKTCVLVDESAGKAGDLYIRSVCFSPDGKYLATGAEDKQIRIWDIAKKRIRNMFDGHQQEIYSLDFSLDGRLIVSGSGDKTARIWDMLDGSSKVLTINDPDSLNNDAGVTSVAISPNGQLVAAGSLDTVVRIWDVATGALVERLRGHRDSVYSVAFTPDGKGLVSGSLDKTLKYWDVSGLMGVGAGGSSIKGRKEGLGSNGGPVGPGGIRKESDKPSPCTMNFTGHKDYVLSVAVSHDGQWVVSGSKDRGVQFWDSRTAIVQCMLQGHKNSVISIDLSPAGSILATGSGDWQARIWSYTTI